MFMKTGLVTIFQVPNYGSVLQAYATQTIIEKLGSSCYIVNYRYPNELQKGNSINIRGLLYRFLTRFGISAQQRKIINLNKFIEQNFHLTKRYNSFDELKAENWSSYDIMIVGSDQVWNTAYTKSEPAFLLQFLPDSIKRISIASSFASKSIESQYRDVFKSELSKFSYITVRETNGLEILKDISLKDKKTAVCLDPILLLSKKEWSNIAKPYNFLGKYILLYMWTYAFEPRPYIFEVIRHFKKNIDNCKIVALEGFCNIPGDICQELNIICAEDSSIPEFIDLFRNASLVITSSFHGTAFAINMGVPLVSIVPNNNSDDRQSSFLRSVNAINSIVKIGQNPTTIDPYYSPEITQEKLNALRKESIDLIKKMIEK